LRKSIRLAKATHRRPQTLADMRLAYRAPNGIETQAGNAAHSIDLRENQDAGPKREEMRVAMAHPVLHVIKTTTSQGISEWNRLRDSVRFIIFGIVESER